MKYLVGTSCMPPNITGFIFYYIMHNWLIAFHVFSLKFLYRERHAVDLKRCLLQNLAVLHFYKFNQWFVHATDTVAFGPLRILK